MDWSDRRTMAVNSKHKQMKPTTHTLGTVTKNYAVSNIRSHSTTTQEHSVVLGPGKSSHASLKVGIHLLLAPSTAHWRVGYAGYHNIMGNCNPLPTTTATDKTVRWGTKIGRDGISAQASHLHFKQSMLLFIYFFVLLSSHTFTIRT